MPATTPLTTMPVPALRKLDRAHFAFMRALAQGVDERTSWDRYLRVEGEHTDLRTVRRTIAWIRDAFAAAARREAKPGTARLILLEPLRDPIAASAPLSVAPPTLQAFAEAAGLEDFSQEEQIEAYAAAYPSTSAGAGRRSNPARRADPRAARRQRLIERQLAALRWLEDLVVQDPRLDDRVDAWFHPALAQRLVRAGLSTLDRLVTHINGVGARWWLHVPGVGERKAMRVLDWLAAHEDVLGAGVGPHVRVPRRALMPATLAAVVPAGTGVLPLEKLRVPAGLDGREGRQRADPAGCRLAASNDLQAIDAWLAAKGTASSKPGLSATQRAYRKEAERLLLWAVLERGEALSSLAAADMTAYDAFLAGPPRHWCGPRHHQRWSPLWRPLEGPLSPAARRHAFAILRSLFGFLVAQGYLAASPLTAAQALPSARIPPLGAGRSFTFAQWDHLRTALARQAVDEPGRRLRRVVQWLYATGLRLTELAQATCGDLAGAAPSEGGAASHPGWTLRVAGPAGSPRQVLVPTSLVTSLHEELVRCGMVGGIADPACRQTPLLMRLDVATGQCVPWSTSAIYKTIKAFMAQVARNLKDEDAAQLRRASTHWLRHTHGKHALQGREGRAGLTLQRVQHNLGHASIATTSAYLGGPTDTSDILATRAFWDTL
ncbi:phage integrase family protein [Variovorax ginsengisoli]|uniref:Integrase n=1 Tax=Variovorax ginsengisoli TaxID=363844 RepID=A0ABT9SD21_9BURK|nr:phage integrase family protein [Variovorax ginsengisoli]MDP9902256.1 integrase [Variovorax ginsengisoli]